MNRSVVLSLFLFLLLSIETVGHFLTMTSVGDWYLTLSKPIWTPPSWLFGPVWTLLYVAIAFAGWLVAVKGKAGRKKNVAFLIFGLQLLANLLWSFFFFFLKSPGSALIDIVVLDGLILLNILFFRPFHRFAALLLIPYLLWTLYATALNGAIYF